jgi:hypothetical protein
MPKQEGTVAPSGQAAVRKVDPEAVERATAGLKDARARVWATARYEEDRVTTRLFVAVPYGEREATNSIDLVIERGSPLKEALEALMAAHLSELLRLGRQGAAQATLAAMASGEEI